MHGTCNVSESAKGCQVLVENSWVFVSLGAGVATKSTSVKCSDQSNDREVRTECQWINLLRILQSEILYWPRQGQW